jgi:hypothetical protein
MSVIVMICFARSGGTILNRCLGSLPRVVCLSEVNPLGGGWGERGPDSFTTVKAQAKNWYGIDLEPDGFTEGILELEKICKDAGSHLVVRDWPFVNFVPHAYNEYAPPNRLLTLEALEGKCDLFPFAFVRDSIDAWISRGTPSADDFFRQYLCYIETVLEKELRIFKYEDFCRAPSDVIRGICEHTGLEYSNSYKSYASFQKVNGDVQILEGSRGVKEGRIKLLRRRWLPRDKIVTVDRNIDMSRANALLGYPVSYSGVPHESIWLKKAKAKISKILESTSGS